ncbi:MAG: hypothetical protein CVU05_10530, partial [Bacteroidetes bacterium HGW-Bacteroidetes-21]
MTKARFHIVLFLIFLGILWLPLIQKTFTLKFEKPLMGDFKTTELVPFSRASWFNESFQNSIISWSNESFGLRSDFVRLHNQFFFWVYGKAFANGVVVGKDQYLYEKKYIDSYLGNDFKGEDALQKEIDKLKFIADTLKKINIDLIVVISPGKGCFYPEYIPNYLLKEKGPTNYGYYVQQFKEKGIQFIDFNDYFIQQKEKSKYPLYPKTGVHWSTYGMSLAADSLIKYMEYVSGMEMPNIIRDTIDVSDIPKGYDQDIEDGINLLFTINKPKYAYPNVRFVSKMIHKKPSVITIGDSFWWGIYYSGIPENVFASHEFL